MRKSGRVRHKGALLCSSQRSAVSRFACRSSLKATRDPYSGRSTCTCIFTGVVSRHIYPDLVGGAKRSWQRKAHGVVPGAFCCSGAQCRAFPVRLPRLSCRHAHHCCHRCYCSSASFLSGKFGPYSSLHDEDSPGQLPITVVPGCHC